MRTHDATEALADFFTALHNDADGAKLHEAWVELEYWLFIVRTRPTLDDPRLPMAEVEKARADYLKCVEKFDDCRACLARVVESLGGQVNSPDDYTGTWHEWLIENAGKLAKAPNTPVAANTNTDAYFDMLTPEQMREIFSLPDDKSCRLAIIAKVDLQAGVLTLVRGDLVSVTIPLSYFQATPTAKPDFSQLKLDDYGMSLCFGECEAAVDTILRWTGAASPRHRTPRQTDPPDANKPPSDKDYDLSILACGKMFKNILYLTGEDKEAGMTDIERLLHSVQGNRAAVQSADLRQLTEATIRWCGERLGMQVDY